MTRHTRRSFLKSAAAGLGAGFAISGTKSSGKILGANERINLGVAGIHGRGGTHINEFARMDGVQVSYLIDPDTRIYKGRIDQVRKLGGNTPQCVQDIREALDDRSLDAVSVATCNHWHSLITFWACQAGKDVYVEKPCSHNPFEGRQCVKAVEKYGRIVQHGTQSRSDSKWAQTVAAVKSGKYGKLLVAKAYASKPGRGRWTVGFAKPKDPPPELDFNIWLGPAPKQPYHENLVHYNWHWFWDFGCGEIGNQGVHQMDIARWGIPGATLPNSAVSMGGRWTIDVDNNYKDQAQTPNMQVTVFDFDGTLLVFEVASLCGKSPITKKDVPRRVDNEFYLDEGKIVGSKFYRNGSEKGEPLTGVEYTLAGNNDCRNFTDCHFQNFIDCVRSRKRENLHADILEAHYSAALCHLGNISYRVGKEVAGSHEPDGFPQNPQVQESIQTIRKHLKDFLDFDLDTHAYQLGRKLTFDAKTEKFVGDDDANKLLTRDYRRPFVVTDEV